MSKIKLNAPTGGGSVSLEAPSSTTSNADIELKLPVADGSAGQFMKTDGSGNLSFGAAGGGKVVKTVHNAAGSQTTIASTTFTDTGGTATITPASSSNKILVFISQTLQFSRSNTSATGGLRIVRLISGGSDHTVYDIPRSGGTLGVNIAGYGATISFRGQICANAEDTPNTTNPITYRVQIAAGTTSDSGQAIANLNNVPCQITLVEVEP